MAGPSATAALAQAIGSQAAKPAQPAAVYDWNGFYFGAHVGYDRGTARGMAPEQDPRRTGFGSLYGGIQAGANYVLPSRMLVGVEADATFPNYLEPDDVVRRRVSGTADFTERMDTVGTLRGRLGWVAGSWLLYGTGGFAWSSTHLTRTPTNGDNEDVRPLLRTGWTAGIGAEIGFEREWSARLEYLYARLAGAGVTFADGGQFASRFDIHMLRLGLNRRLGWDFGTVATADTPEGATELSHWEVHGQLTAVGQGYPAFRALYSGANSLSPAPQAKETFTATAFLGFRLWDGGELYYNPELDQGFGLSSTVGAGGFPNGEAQKSDFLYPHYHTARLFLRQTFGFGGEQENVESAANQLAGKRDVSRLTLQAGRISVKDVFDGNTYASDPRAHFLNWSLWAAGAFDYPADKVGVTYGTTAELNQANWALRTGYFLVSSVSNSNYFDKAIGRRGGYIAEVESRYSLAGRAGRLRVIGWVNSVFSGDYRDAVVLAGAIPSLDPTDAIAQTRRSRIKYGYVFNVEQSVTDDIGLFGRWSWNDGRNEIMAFTDIDASLSFGTSIKGAVWGRPKDTIGIGMAVNGLSRPHRDYLAAGGLGILVGDGALNYRTEKVLETYYAIGLPNEITVTLDYQFLSNPAYNADRGPVHIFAARLHAEM